MHRPRIVPDRPRIVPGYTPTRCPCGSDHVFLTFLTVPWPEKRLVRPSIEVKGALLEAEKKKKEVAVYKCAKCGAVLSKAFLSGEEITFDIPPQKEAYVEDFSHVLHYLVTTDSNDPVRPNYGAIAVVESRLVTPPKPGSAMVIRLRVPITYMTRNGKPCWCITHERVETVESEAFHTKEYSQLELRTFSELIHRKRARGLKPLVTEGVLAYLVACQRGTKSLITGFLRASGIPEYKSTSDSSVGQDLSRMQKLGLTPPEFDDYWRIAEREIDGKVAVSYIPVRKVLSEKEYILRRELPGMLRRKPDWWTVLDVERKEDAPKNMGLDKWIGE